MDPIGQTFRAGPELRDTTRPPGTIVGVVGDVKQASLDTDPEPAFYVSLGQWPWVDTVETLAVRTAGDPTALVAPIREAIWSADRNDPVTRVAPMSALVARSQAKRQFVLTVFEAFGASALALSAIGIFGMISGGVTERLRELSVRAALGASGIGLLLLVIRQGIGLVALGLLIGTGGAALANGAISTLLFGVTRADAVTYASASAIILAVAFVASAGPAWRAARVDPIITLRA